ncbi:MAG: hypothetical protein IJL87_07725 [Clostridia bacterium]|nr:hypothetical protein [Clostridia bacterium]
MSTAEKLNKYKRILSWYCVLFIPFSLPSLFSIYLPGLALPTIFNIVAVAKYAVDEPVLIPVAISCALVLFYTLMLVLAAKKNIIAAWFGLSVFFLIDIIIMAGVLVCYGGKLEAKLPMPLGLFYTRLIVEAVSFTAVSVYGCIACKIKKERIIKTRAK